MNKLHTPKSSQELIFLIHVSHSSITMGEHNEIRTRTGVRNSWLFLKLRLLQLEDDLLPHKNVGIQSMTHQNAALYVGKQVEHIYI